MALPKQVVEGARRAEALVAGVTGKRSGEDAPSDEPAMQQKPEAKATELAPDAAGVEHDWKQRFSQYKSSSDATIHQLRESEQSLRERENELRERIHKLERERIEAEASVPMSLPEGALSQDEVELFGSENLEILKKVVAPMVMDYVERRLAGVNSKVEERLSAKDAEEARKAEQRSKLQSFKIRLTKAFPEWKDFDMDSKFASWMQEEDPVSGLKRAQLMMNAFQAHDVDRVAIFYKTFAALAERTDPRDSMIVPQTQTNATKTPQQSANKGRLWTGKMVAELYSAKSKGYFKGKEEEYRALEHDLFAAQREGRYRD